MFWIRTFLHYFNLEADIDDFDTIHKTIEKDIVFKGTNLWILMFAIIIASVGLNVNSTAVIIGAMLISPLMGPINGMGYSIATYNFTLFRRSIKNFTFAVIAGLIASTAYFFITPISTAHSELLARTSPTIYDVIIALFGGLAGIVAISSKQKGNVIPGVAIATALIPPLCTAGYGLATLTFKYFLGAFYLFTINTVFIAISSILISRILKFPIRGIVDENHKKRLRRWITVIIVITVVPSIYFAILLINQEKFSEKAILYTGNVSVFEGNYLLNKEINSINKSIKLIYGGNTFTEEQKHSIRMKAVSFGLDTNDIVIEQGISFDYFKSKDVENFQLKDELSRIKIDFEKEKYRTDSIKNIPLLGRQLLNEIRTLFPNVKACSYSETFLYSETEEPISAAVVILKTGRSELEENEKHKIQLWLKERIKKDRIDVYYDDIFTPVFQ